MTATRVILTDVEGTTTSIAFVADTLFPYARAHLDAYAAAHADAVALLLADARAEAETPDLDDAATLDLLRQWMDEDRKATPLKTLQGMIWADGYAAGTLTGHIYPDAVVALRAWHTAGYRLAVYSSGSEAAQKLLFRHSDAGDLSTLFEAHFDTRVGAKQEAASYRRIAAMLDVAPAEILFLSDHPAEIGAAEEAGMRAILVDRTGAGAVASFAEIDPA